MKIVHINRYNASRTICGSGSMEYVKPAEAQSYLSHHPRNEGINGFRLCKNCLKGYLP
jgi:hypothetical protein